MISLKEKYNKEAVPALMKKFGYKSIMAVPKIKKVVINTGIGRMVVGKGNDEVRKTCEAVVNDLTTISGQKAVITKAKKSIATFKTRAGMPLGAMVTLRGSKMYDFLEKYINIALPRSRDFKGLDAKGFDSTGNLTIAVKEDIIFPEISPEKVKFLFGFEIVVNTTAKTKEEGEELLRLMGFPLKKHGN